MEYLDQDNFIPFRNSLSDLGSNSIPFMNNNIANLRRARGWTQDQLAEAASVTQPTINKAEQGKGTNKTLRKIAAGLGVPFFTLWVSDADDALARIIVSYQDATSGQQEIYHRLAGEAKAGVREEAK